MQRRPTAVLLNDTRVDLHHGCNRVVEAILKLLEKNGIDLIASHPAHSDWSADGAFLAAMERAQLIVVNGEGTIHHNSQTGRWLLRAGAFAKARGIPAVLVNCGWEANGPEMVAMLDDFALISFRDHQSAAVMQGRPCRVVPDLSLYPVGDVPLQHRTNGIGFTDSVDRFKALALDHCREIAGGQTVSIIYSRAGPAGYLRFMRAGVSLRRDLSPMVFSRFLTMRHRLWRAGSADTEAFLSRLAALKLLVSGRFHACTLALVTETPFVALPSNTGKIDGLIADAGLEPWRGDISLEPEQLHAAATRGWSPAERQALREYRCAAQSQAEALFCDMRALI
jgi:hypothetical protein